MGIIHNTLHCFTARTLTQWHNVATFAKPVLGGLEKAVIRIVSHMSNIYGQIYLQILKV